jgi:signal peptidase II
MVKEKSGSKLFFLAAAMIVILDQITKLIAMNLFSEPLSLLGGFFSFLIVKNHGAGFGILQGQGFLLIIVSAIVIGSLIYYHSGFIGHSGMLISMGLVLGGAFGNLIDRIMLGYVIDFISFSFWPAFNIADSAITIGAAGMIYYYLKH